jgi:hypothetical protein
VLNCFDQVKPNDGPEPVTPALGLAISDIDSHFKVPRRLAENGRLDAPERLQIVIYLVEEVLHNDRLLLLGKLEPPVEAGRRVSTSTLAISLGCVLDGVRLLGHELCVYVLGIVDELANGMGVVGAWAGGVGNDATIVNIPRLPGLYCIGGMAFPLAVGRFVRPFDVGTRAFWKSVVEGVEYYDDKDNGDEISHYT